MFSQHTCQTYLECFVVVGRVCCDFPVKTEISENAEIVLFHALIRRTDKQDARVLMEMKNAQQIRQI